LADANRIFTSTIKHSLNHISPALSSDLNEAACRRFITQDQKLLRSEFRKHADSANIRLQIAHCYLKLGKLKQARLMFELVLKSNSMHVDALVGLAITKLTENESLPFANELCVQFSKECSIYTIKTETLNTIAFDYFTKENYATSERYAEFVIRRSSDFYQLTKSYNLLGKIAENKVM
jgi:RNA polymerase-associated protein CTR9